MRTSGDLKSGDSLFFATPRNLNGPPNPHPPTNWPSPRWEWLSALYEVLHEVLLSKFAIIILMPEIIFVSDLRMRSFGMIRIRISDPRSLVLYPGRWNEPMNPCPEWIHRFIWSTIWFPCEMSAEIPFDDTVVLLLQCILVMPRGKFASTSQKHHLDLRLFTDSYFSVKPSRSSAMHYGWPSLVSWLVPPPKYMTLITRLDSAHMKPRLSPVMQSTQSHRKIRYCMNSLPRSG